jgi:hypothetical protein
MRRCEIFLIVFMNEHTSKRTPEITHLHVAPTIPDLLAMGRAKGIDRFAVVQRPDADYPQGVAVCLLSSEAICEAGPFLADHILKLPLPPAELDESVVHVAGETTLPQQFAALRKLGLHWACLPLYVPGLVLPHWFMLFQGERVDEAV